MNKEHLQELKEGRVIRKRNRNITYLERTTNFSINLTTHIKPGEHLNYHIPDSTLDISTPKVVDPTIKKHYIPGTGTSYRPFKHAQNKKKNLVSNKFMYTEQDQILYLDPEGNEVTKDYKLIGYKFMLVGTDPYGRKILKMCPYGIMCKAIIHKSKMQLIPKAEFERMRENYE